MGDPRPASRIRNSARLEYISSVLLRGFRCVRIGYAREKKYKGINSNAVVMHFVYLYRMCSPIVGK